MFLDKQKDKMIGGKNKANQNVLTKTERDKMLYLRYGIKPKSEPKPNRRKTEKELAKDKKIWR